MSEHLSEFWSRYRRVRNIETTSAVRLFEATSGAAARVVVYEIEHSDKVPSAVLSRALHEIRRLSDLPEDRLVRPVEVATSNDFSHIVLSIPDGERLADRMAAKMSLTTTLGVARCLLQILTNVHEADLVLRCLCPNELLLNSSSTDGSTQPAIGGCPPLMLLTTLDNGLSSCDMLRYAAPETLGA